MGKFAVTVKNGWLDSVTSSTMYLGLFVGDPSGGGSELSGSNYARKEVLAADWNAASSSALTNANALSFPQSTGVWSASNVTYFGLYTALTGGTLQFSDDLPVAQQQPIAEGNTVTFGVGQLSLTITDPA